MLKRCVVPNTNAYRKSILFCFGYSRGSKSNLNVIRNFGILILNGNQTLGTRVDDELFKLFFSGGVEFDKHLNIFKRMLPGGGAFF